MDGDRPSLKAELRKLAAQSRRSLGPHPTPEQLTAYQAGELPEDESERLRDHLALCHDCADLLLDLEGFSNLEATEGERVPSDADVDAAWQDLRARLQNQNEGRPIAGATKPEPTAAVVPIQRKASILSSLRFAYGLAATFLIAAVGLGVWSAQQARQPRLGASARYLEAVGEETRSSAEKLLSSRAEQNLILSAPGESGIALYQVEILEGDKVVWASQPTEVDSEESELLLQLQIPPSFLSPGRYLVRLYRVADEEKTAVRDFSLQIEQ